MTEDMSLTDITDDLNDGFIKNQFLLDYEKCVTLQKFQLLGTDMAANPAIEVLFII